MKKLLLYISVIIFTFFSSAWCEDKQNIIEKIIKNPIDDDLWYGSYFDDAKIGWINLKQFLNKDVFIINFNFKFISEFQGQIETTSIEQVLTFDKNPPYLLLKHSEITTNENEYSSLINGNRKNNDFVVEFEEGNSKRIETLKNFDYSLYDILAPSIWIFNSPQIGEKINWKEYDFVELRYIDTKSEIFDYEKFI